MRGQDIDEFLSKTTPEKFDELIAMDRIVPFGDEKVCWVIASAAATLVNRVNLLCQSWGAKDLPTAKPKDFIPWAKKKKKKTKYINPNAMAAAFKMAVQ